MKKTLCAILMLAALAGAENRTKFSVDPVLLLVAGTNNFQLERTFLDGKLGWAFYHARTGGASREFGGYTVSGSEQSLLGKWYFGNVARSSLWLGGALSVAGGNVYKRNSMGLSTLSNSARNVGTLGVHALIGYQWNWGGFILEPYSGVGWAVTNNLYGENWFDGDVEETRLLLRYGAQAGFAF